MTITHKMSFAIDAIDGAFDGYGDDDVSWNGWACPYFEYATAIDVLKRSESNGYTWSYDAVHDAFVVRHTADPAGYEPEIFESLTILVEHH
jgi:hypothetical protein